MPDKRIYKLIFFFMLTSKFKLNVRHLSNSSFFNFNYTLPELYCLVLVSCLGLETRVFKVSVLSQCRYFQVSEKRHISAKDVSSYNIQTHYLLHFLVVESFISLISKTCWNFQLNNSNNMFISKKGFSCWIYTILSTWSMDDIKETVFLG